MGEQPADVLDPESGDRGGIGQERVRFPRVILLGRPVGLRHLANERFHDRRVNRRSGVGSEFVRRFGECGEEFVGRRVEQGK